MFMIEYLWKSSQLNELMCQIMLTRLDNAQHNYQWAQMGWINIISFSQLLICLGQHNCYWKWNVCKVALIVIRSQQFKSFLPRPMVSNTWKSFLSSIWNQFKWSEIGWIETKYVWLNLDIDICLKNLPLSISSKSSS